MYGDGVDRGGIKDRQRYLQSKLISYEGLERRRKITPTDIDGFMDYNGNLFIYIDGKLDKKYKDCGLDYGQKKSYENVVNSHFRAGNIAIVIIFTHDCKPDEIIIAKDKPVVEYYFKGMWHKPKQEGETLLHFIEKLENYCEENGYNI